MFDDARLVAAESDLAYSQPTKDDDLAFPLVFRLGELVWVSIDPPIDCPTNKELKIERWPGLISRRSELPSSRITFNISLVNIMGSDQIIDVLQGDIVPYLAYVPSLPGNPLALRSFDVKVLESVLNVSAVFCFVLSPDTYLYSV